jgi:hypothetical protein
VTRRGHVLGRLPAGVLVAVLAGCSGPESAVAGSFSAAPLTTLTSSSGALSVEIRTSPQPPVRGIIDAELTVTRVADGSPVDGLAVAVSPWMPAMNHGASTPTITPEGGGKYLVTELDLFMAGFWELRTTLSGDAGSEAVTPSFDVQ